MHRKIAILISALAALLALGSTGVLAAADSGAKRAPGTYGQTTLKVDAGTLEALGTLGVTPGAVAPGTLTGATYAFPITNSPTSVLRSGVVRHRGGISLRAGETTVKLTDFGIRLLHRELWGKVNGAGPVALLDLDYSNARVRLRGSRVHVGGIGSTLTPGAADALNDAFGTSALSDDTRLGKVSVHYRLSPR